MAKVVVVRVKEKETPKPEKKNYLQLIVSCVTAIVAVLGIVLSYMSFSLTAEEKAAQRLQARNSRFTYAIEHLKDESLAIRMGALFELKKLGLEDDGFQENIVQILGPFVREGIENKELLLSLEYGGGLLQPNEDIYIACEITSLFWEQTGYRISLNYLQAEKLRLSDINLQGAYLIGANFQGASLSWAQLQGASLSYAQFQGANLDFTHLEGAKHLTVAQLFAAVNVYTAKLDPALRAEYDRLKAEQQ